MGTVLKHQAEVTMSSEMCSSSTAQKYKSNYLKAVKADNAAVEENLWNDRLKDCRGNHEEQTQLRVLNILHDTMLKRYRLNITRSFIKYLTIAHGKEWSALVVLSKTKTRLRKQKHGEK
eukprot:11411249-Ditylum_brightwellii.AAC.1